MTLTKRPRALPPPLLLALALLAPCAALASAGDQAATFTASPAPAPATAPAPALKEGSVTFLDSKLFDNMLSKELAGDKDIVEVNIAGRVTLNNIPARVDTWITAVGENGELTLKVSEPALKPKFVLALLPIVYSLIKQSSLERTLEPAKRYNATILYHIDKGGESVIEKIVFVRKKP